MHTSLDSALGRQRRLNQIGETINSIATPAAAYSLRSLTGGDPLAVRIRRESDNTEKDFTVSGVSSGAMVNFVNAQTVKPLDIRALESDGDRDGDFQIASAAYSLRSLGDRQATVTSSGDTDGDTSGKYVIQVRRSSDDAIKSFTADEVTDGTLVAFVGSGNNGRVRTWYDQSVTDQGGGTATGNHAIQTDVAKQPLIVSSGTLVTGGIDFDGFNDHLSTSSGLNLTSSDDLSVFLVANADAASGQNPIVSQEDGTGTGRSYIESGSTINTFLGGSEQNFGSASASQSIITLLYDDSANTLDAFKNGSQSGSQKTSITVEAASGVLNIAINKPGSQFFDGKISEVIIYLSDQAANRGAFEGNMADHYSITGVPTGANTVNGFVTTWYDQIGSNNLVQDGASNQPQIVNSGSLLSDGIEFDGSNDRFVSSNPITITTSSDISFSLVGESDNITSTQTIISQKSGTGQGRSWTDIVSSNFRTSIGGSAKTFGAVSANETTFLYTFIFDESANTANAFKNGSQSGSQRTINAAEAANGELVVGSNNGETGQFLNGHLKELIVYLSDQSSNRVALETNINSYYSIF